MSDGESPDSVHLRLGGFGLVVEGLSNVTELSWFLDPFRARSDGTSQTVRTYRILENGGDYLLSSSDRTEVILRTGNRGDFLLLFDRVLIDTFLEFTPFSTVHVHAAVFESDGTLLVFPGEGGAGKTTVAEELLHRTDWTFLTDELLVVDPDQRRVYPFPHPLNIKSSLRHESTDTFTVTDSTGQEFTYGLPPRARIATRPINVDGLRVFHLDRSDDCVFNLGSLSISSGLQRLFLHSLKPSNSSDRFHRITSLKTLSPECFVMRYEEASDLDPAVLLPNS